MNILLTALDLLAASLDDGPVRSPSTAQLDDCLPTMGDVEHLYVNNRPTLEANLLDYLNEVGDRWQRANNKGLHTLLHQAGATAASAPPIEKPHGLVGATFSRYDDRVSFDQMPVGVAVGLLQEVRAAAVATLTTDLGALAEGLQQLRRLDDLLIRVLAARRVADELQGVTLGEVLALYRTEGNLGVPRSARSLNHGIPPMKADDPELTSIRNEGSGLSPNIARLVMLESETLYSNQGNDTNARALALFWWMVHIAGLDFIDKPMMVLSPPANPTSHREGFGMVSAIIRSAHTGVEVTPAQREDAWDALAADLDVRKVGRGPDGVLNVVGWTSSTDADTVFVRAAPNDPERLVAAALAEGVLLLRYLGAPERICGEAPPPMHSPPDWIAPSHLSYALYNLQVGLRLGFLLSAVSYAILDRKGPAIHQALRDELSAHPVWGDDLHTAREIRAAPMSLMETVQDAFGPALQEWFLDSARGQQRIELVDHFIATANTTTWKSWNSLKRGSPRGNAHRYHLAYVYYHLLTGEARPF